MTMKNRIFISAIGCFIFLALVSFIIVNISISNSFHSLTEIEKEKLILKSKDFVKNIVDLAYQNILKVKEYSEKKDPANAKELAAQLTRAMKFENNTNYIFIINSEGYTFVHPSQEGKSLLNAKDPDGYPFIQNLIKAAKENSDGGFVQYKWNKIKDTAPIPKISYARYIKEWDWVIGAGIYIEDIEKNIDEMRGSLKDKQNDMFLLLFVTTFFIIAIAIFVMNKQINIAMIPLGNISISLREIAGKLQAAFQENLLSVNIQKEKVTETSTSITELTASIQEISSNAVSADKLSLSAKNSATDGEQAVEKTLERLTDITQNVKTAGEMTKKLGDRSKEIDNIVKTITDISEQTNLLALNAAIEAARAGDQGRGFAVVADEVRKLAERSSKSAQEIRDIIEKIQMEMQNTIKIIDSSTKSTIDGMYVAESLKESIANIMTNVVSTTDSITEISTALKQQAEVCDTISTAADKITENIKNVDDKNNQMQSYIVNLQETAGTLETQMNQFKKNN